MAAILAGPMLRGDAIVLLAGEDGLGRLAMAQRLIAEAAAPVIVITGGIDGDPRWHGAGRLRDTLIGNGVSPDRIIVDAEAKNTREQAVNVVAIAKEKGWGRILLCASPYHITRAYLTFLRAIQEAKLTDKLHVLSVPCSQLPWSQSPPGLKTTRLELLEDEAAKMELYGNHVAHYTTGLKYLQSWEGR